MSRMTVKVRYEKTRVVNDLQATDQLSVTVSLPSMIGRGNEDLLVALDLSREEPSTLRELMEKDLDAASPEPSGDMVAEKPSGNMIAEIKDWLVADNAASLRPYERLHLHEIERYDGSVAGLSPRSADPEWVRANPGWLVSFKIEPDRPAHEVGGIRVLVRDSGEWELL